MVRFDKNDDGKLTEDEVPEGPWARMTRADADKDGIVTKEELKKELKRLPMIGPRGRIDRRPVGQLRGHRPAGPAKERPDKREKKAEKGKKKAEE